MGLISMLNIGSRALGNYSTAIEVTGNNIANASTPGYHRQSVQIVAGAVERQIGDGAYIGGIQRAFNAFTESQVNHQTSMASGYGLESQTLSMVDSLFNETTIQGLSGAMDTFYTSLADLANDPSSGAVRTTVLSTAETLSRRFNDLSADLQGIRGEMDTQIASDLARVNELTRQIADINDNLVMGEGAGANIGTLQDQQAQLITELAQFVPLEVDYQTDGQVSVVIAGRAVVQGEEYHQLSSSQDPDDGTLTILYEGTGGALQPMHLNGEASIGAAVKLRDVTLDTYAQELDTLAYEFANRLNEVHEAGYGLDGVDGRSFFDINATAAGAAASIRVSADIVGNPDALAAASDPNYLPADSTNAVNLYETSFEAITGLGEATFHTFYGELAAQVGQDTREAEKQYEVESAELFEVSALRDSQSGVNMDEEAAELQRYEYAYQAAARYIGVVDEMMDVLMRMAA